MHTYISIRVRAHMFATMLTGVPNDFPKNIFKKYQTNKRKCINNLLNKSTVVAATEIRKTRNVNNENDFCVTHAIYLTNWQSYFIVKNIYIYILKFTEFV